MEIIKQPTVLITRGQSCDASCLHHTSKVFITLVMNANCKKPFSSVTFF